MRNSDGCMYYLNSTGLLRFEGWGVHDCDRTEAAGVRCQPRPAPATTTTTTPAPPKLPMVEAATSHRERGRLGRGWRVGEPGVQSLQCRYREKLLLQTDNTADLSLSVARSGVW